MSIDLDSLFPACGKSTDPAGVPNGVSQEVAQAVSSRSPMTFRQAMDKALPHQFFRYRQTGSVKEVITKPQSIHILSVFSIPNRQKNIKSHRIPVIFSFFKNREKVLDKMRTACYNLRVRFETPV